MKASLQHENSGLELKNLNLARGETLLCQNVSVRVDAGEILWVSGSNGIGKTSLLSCIAGLLRPDFGEIYWQNKPQTAYTHIGWQHKGFAMKGQLSVRENLYFWQKMQGNKHAKNKTISRTQNEVLEKFGLSDQKDKPAAHLSLGQQQRLGLARLWQANHALWLLDEPLSGLDAQGRELLEEILHAHCQARGCAVIASHIPLKITKQKAQLLTLSAGG